MIDHLLFDTTDFDTMDDTHSVGAYVRSGESGALISHHGFAEASSLTFDFVDGDVTVGTDTIAETAHGLHTGDVIQLTSTGTLPAGLALATDYYVIRVDADSFQLAADATDAERGVPVTITAAAGGGTHTVTEQTKDGRALDVYMVNDLTITAVDLDIRDLDHTQDSVAIGDGTDLLDINADGSINVVAGAEKVEDSAHSSGDTGNFMLAVRNDIEGTLVDTDGDYAPLQVDSSGRLRVIADLDFTVGAEKAEDAAHSSGDTGNYVLAVRQDTLAASTDADGDYSSFKVDSLGRLYVTGEDDSLANTAIASAQNLLGVANTAEDVVAAPLTNRKYLYIYNNDNRKLYVGASGVTSTSGFPLSPGSYLELRAGASIDIEWVSAKVNHDMRHMELS